MDDNFTLETDASQFGLGACLLQNDRPVAYISRSLNKTEQNYSKTEREFWPLFGPWKSWNII